MRKKEKVLFNRNYNMMMLVGLLIAFGYSMISTLISSYAVEIGASLTIAVRQQEYIRYQHYWYAPSAV